VLTASDDDTVTSVTSSTILTSPSKCFLHGSVCTLRRELEKNFTSSNFVPGQEALLTNPSTPEPDKPLDPQAEYDRLMHARKGISGTEFAGLGIQFAVIIVLFAFAGIWLDKRLGTSPLFVIILVLGGAGLGFWSMYRGATKKGGR
jgi:hypothetical protein